MVGSLVIGILEILSNGVINYLMKPFSLDCIFAFIFSFNNLRLSSCPSITLFVDFYKPTLVSSLASPRSMKCKEKSSIDISSSLPSLMGLETSMVRCPISGSCPRMDKVFYFLTLLNANPKWIARDDIFFGGSFIIPLSFSI